MTYCASCGHELGVGRFCTNCGQPINRVEAPAPTHAASPPTQHPSQHPSQPAPPPTQPPPTQPVATTPPPSAPPRSATPPPAPPAPPGPPGAPPTAPPPPPPALPVEDTGLTATDERRAARLGAALTPGPPRTPPSADDTPPPPRFPLFADEVATDPRTQVDLAPVDDRAWQGWQTGTGDLPPVAPPTGGFLDRFGASAEPAPATRRTPEEAYAALHAAAAGEHHDHDRPRRRWPLVLAALVTLALLAALVGWLVTRDDDDDDPAGTASDTPAAADPADLADLAAQAKVKTPGAAPDAQEAGGGTATFAGANMLDGKPETAWRVAGDASGQQVVFTFPEPVVISEVGLVNGYAKIGQEPGGRRFDWYHGNRTISQVTWVFDDGSLVSQDLDRNRRMQTTPVDDVTTTTVTLRLVDVSEPGTGRARRDFTAISDVTLLGTPAS